MFSECSYGTYLSTSFVKIDFYPTTRRTSRTTTKFDQKFHKKNDQCIFGKSGKRLKMKSQERKTSFLVNWAENCAFIGSCDFNFNFFVSVSTLPVILSFLKFFVAQTSLTNFFFNFWKVKYLRHLKINHPYFFSESSFGIYLQISSERNSNLTTRRILRTTSRCSSTRNIEIKFNERNHRNCWVNLPIVFIFFCFVKKKFKSNHQENLESIV